MRTKIYLGLVAVTLFAVTLIMPEKVFALSAPAGFQVETYVSGLTLPTSFAFAPDGRIFIAEKSGRVRVVKNGALLPTPVYIVPRVNDYSDRGLIGIALDPNFAQNGHMYLSYTYENTPGANYSGPKTGQIIRVTVVGDTASDSTKVVLVGKVTGDGTKPSCENFATSSDCIASDAQTHSMGALRFGPDGKLYASLGDGAGFDQADSRAMRSQNLNSLAGKLLRINKDGTAPTDNPFYSGDPNANRSKVWAYGLRNGYRFNFRPSNGAIYLGDVGWSTWEELNIVSRGANLGWPCREGMVKVPEYNCEATNAQNPAYVYDHSVGSGAVSGGTFPDNNAYPTEYMGSFYMADYAQNWIKKVRVDASNNVLGADNFISDAGGPVDILTGLGGNIFYLSIYTGELRRIKHTGTTTPTNPPTGPAKPRHLTTKVSPDPSYIGNQLTLTTTIANDGGTEPFTVKIYVFDKNGNEIVYKYYERQVIETGQTRSFDMTWLPPGLGDYAVKVGLFSPDWIKLHQWTDRALTVSVVERNQIPTTPVAPVHVSTAVTPTSGSTGQARTITTSIKNNGGTGSILVDMEVYRGATKVDQKFFDGDSIAAGQTKNYTLTLTPNTTGDHKVSVGLFRPGWGPIYSWTDTATTFSVGSGGTGPTDPPATTTPPTTSGLIYGDSLATGWENWSWDTDVNFAETDPVREGTRSTRATYKSAWAGFLLHHAGISTTGKTNLKFSINGSHIGEQALQVMAYNSAGAAMAPVPLDRYKGGTKLNANTWSDIIIPLADLGADNKTITGFLIQGRDGQVQMPWVIDNVRVE